MRAKLLNDGGYCGMEGVDFPVEVEGVKGGNDCVDVSGSELCGVGAGCDFLATFGYAFFIGTECEIVEED